MTLGMTLSMQFGPWSHKEDEHPTETPNKILVQKSVVQPIILVQMGMLEFNSLLNKMSHDKFCSD